MTKKSILSALTEYRFGLTVREIVTATGLAVGVISAELFRLESEGKVSQRTVGRDVVWSTTTPPATAPAGAQPPQRVERVTKASCKTTQETPPSSPAQAESLPPISGHLHLDLKEGAVRVPFSDVNTLRDFVNDLATRSPQ